MGISKRLALFVAFVLFFWCYDRVQCDEGAMRGAPSGATPPNEEKAGIAANSGIAATTPGNGATTPGGEGKDKGQEGSANLKGGASKEQAAKGETATSPASGAEGAQAQTTFLQSNERQQASKDGGANKDNANSANSVSSATNKDNANSVNSATEEEHSVVKEMTPKEEPPNEGSAKGKDGAAEKAGALRSGGSSGGSSGEAKGISNGVTNDASNGASNGASNDASNGAPKEDAASKSTKEEFYDELKKQNEEEKNADMNFLKILSIASSLFMQLVLFPSIIKMIKKKTTGEVDGLPYVVLLFSSFLWLVYGMLLNNSAIVCPNLVGLVLGAFYSLMYHKYCKNMWLKQKLFSYYKICGFICLLLYAFLYVLTYEQYELFVGFMAFISSIVNFGAPLSYVQIVIKKKNSSLIPLEIATGSLVCSFLWVTYGFTIKDGFVIVPNLCGFILSLLQIALILLYSNKEAIVNYEDGEQVDFVTDSGGMHVSRKNRYTPTENHIFLNDFNLDPENKMGSSE
ncbi:MtN3/saliva family, partial [Plasmodium cynomolgi strain B]